MGPKRWLTERAFKWREKGPANATHLLERRTTFDAASALLEFPFDTAHNFSLCSFFIPIVLVPTTHLFLKLTMTTFKSFLLSLLIFVGASSAHDGFFDTGTAGLRTPKAEDNHVPMSATSDRHLFQWFGWFRNSATPAPGYPLPIYGKLGYTAPTGAPTAEETEEPTLPPSLW